MARAMAAGASSQTLSCSLSPNQLRALSLIYLNQELDTACLYCLKECWLPVADLTITLTLALALTLASHGLQETRAGLTSTL